MLEPLLCDYCHSPVDPHRRGAVALVPRGLGACAGKRLRPEAVGLERYAREAAEAGDTVATQALQRAAALVRGAVAELVGMRSEAAGKGEVRGG